MSLLTIWGRARLKLKRLASYMVNCGMRSAQSMNNIHVFRCGASTPNSSEKNSLSRRNKWEPVCPEIQGSRRGRELASCATCNFHDLAPFWLIAATLIARPANGSLHPRNASNGSQEEPGAIYKRVHQGPSTVAHSEPSLTSTAGYRNDCICETELYPWVWHWWWMQWTQSIQFPFQRFK